MVNRAVADDLAGHFLQTYRLGGELDIVVDLIALFAVLVFHRVNLAVGMKLHHVALADQAEAFRPHRQCPLAAHALEALVTRFVDPLMGDVTALGVDIVREGLLQMDQTALARAVAPVLEGGEHDGVLVGVGWHRAALHGQINRSAIGAIQSGTSR